MSAFLVVLVPVGLMILALLMSQVEKRLHTTGPAVAIDAGAAEAPVGTASVVAGREPRASSGHDTEGRTDALAPFPKAAAA